MYEAVSEHERVSRAEVENRAAVLMKKIGLTDCARVLGSYPFELSGGMNQRVGNLYRHAFKTGSAPGR